MSNIVQALEDSGRFDAVVDNEDGTIMVADDGVAVTLNATEMVDPDAED